MSRRISISGTIALVLALSAVMAPAQQEQPADPRPRRVEQLQAQIQAHTQAIEKLAEEVQAGQRDIASYTEALKPHIEQITELQRQLKVLLLEQHQVELRQTRQKLASEEAARVEKKAEAAPARPAQPPSYEETIQQYHAAWMHLGLHIQELAVQHQLGQITEQQYDEAMQRWEALNTRQEQLAPALELLAQEMQRRQLQSMEIEAPGAPAGEEQLREAQKTLLRFAQEVRAAVPKPDRTETSSGKSERPAEKH